jgi:hypothetical protein
MPHVQDGSISLLGFERDKTNPDLSGEPGFWLPVRAAIYLEVRDLITRGERLVPVLETGERQ